MTQTERDRLVALKKANKTTAATPERQLAICQPVRLTAFSATPPVENRMAAVTSSRRSRKPEDAKAYPARLATCLAGC